MDYKKLVDFAEANMETSSSDSSFVLLENSMDTDEERNNVDSDTRLIPPYMLSSIYTLCT